MNKGRLPNKFTRKDKKNISATYRTSDSSVFLPVCRKDMEKRGWNELDILLISGDAYVDHASFGIPLLGRVLENEGYRVGIISQPKWDSPDDITVMGRPKLFVGISSGCLDSMLAHYTAFRKKRHDDSFTPGGKCGSRPNRAVIVYANLVRQAFKGTPIIIGGIEASLRKAAHYDFWTDSIRQSILLNSKADLLLYGMGERSILEVAEKVKTGQPLEQIRGSVAIVKEIKKEALGNTDLTNKNQPLKIEALPSLEEIKSNPKALIQATLKIEEQMLHADTALIQDNNGRKIIINPPAKPLSSEELDNVYALPFTREAHWSYKEKIPAFNMVQWSISAVRGCGGGCSFCSLASHQGRVCRSRNEDSIIEEIKKLISQPDWKGSISDIGGPTANAWGSYCGGDPKNCSRQSCYSPQICPNLKLNQGGYLKMLNKISSLKNVKNLRVASGIRYDVALKDENFIEGICADYVGGQLKLAPEHCTENVLKLMRKSNFSLFEKFITIFDSINRKTGKKQFIIPYVMSAFPGCEKKDMKELADWFKSKHWNPQQVQCFIPTPGTLATAMYYAESDIDGNKIYVAKTDKERLEQHSYIAPKIRQNTNNKNKFNRTKNRRRPNGKKTQRRN
jgi:uncharacterized radical SAM protein YgiQ